MADTITKTFRLITITNANITTQPKEYSVYDLSDNTEFQNLLSAGYVPVNCYNNGDTLAVGCQCQSFLSRWFIRADNLLNVEATINNVVIVMVKAR